MSTETNPYTENDKEQLPTLTDEQIEVEDVRKSPTGLTLKDPSSTGDVDPEGEDN